MPNRESSPLELFESYQAYLSMQHLHEAALKQLQIKFEVLNNELRAHSGRNPIHHIETRLKSTTSIITKLRKRNFEVSLDSAQANLNDIAGIRVVCSYIDDVYAVAEMLLRQSDITLVKTQDYIKDPNYNGYRSLHLDIRIPVYLSDHIELVNVEVQLRTIAMDFWASLEHDLRYKSGKDIPPRLLRAMLNAADDIAAIDGEMQDIYREIQALPNQTVK